MLRISVLCQGLRVAGGMSVGKNIVAALLEVAPSHEYQVFVPQGLGYPVAGGPRVNVVEVPSHNAPARLWFEVAKLRPMVSASRPDWVLSLGNIPMRKPEARQALLVHDPHLVYPRSHYPDEGAVSNLRTALLVRSLRRDLRYVDVLFCQTETMRRRTVGTYGFAGRTAMLPNAVSKFVLGADGPPGAASPSPRAPAALDVPTPLRPFADRFKLLVLTKYYTHKNLERIVETYDRFRTALGNTLIVLTVREDQHRDAGRFLQSIRARGLEDLIVNVGPLAQEDLPQYFRACGAMLLPTLLESFSGTYLEAMHFERPVVTSDLDFAREICGNAAVYFDPWRADSMRDAIVRLRDDAELRGRIREAGRQRLQAHYRSWPDIVRSALNEMGVPHDAA